MTDAGRVKHHCSFVDKKPTKNIEIRNSIIALEDIVQCPICSDTLTDPKMLPCQHTFCFSCLQANLPENTHEFVCPSCDEITVFEDGSKSLVHLPENLYINSILYLLKGGSPLTPTTPGVKCIKCQTVCQFFDYTCEHCRQVFCKICWPVHLTDIKQHLKLLLKKCQESLYLLDHQVDAFKNRYAQLENTIRKVAEIKIAEIKQKEQACLQQSSKLRNKNLNVVEDLRQKITDMAKNTDEKFFDEIADDMQKVQYFKSLQSATTIILKEFSEWDDHCPIFDENTFKIDNEIGSTLEADDVDIVKLVHIQNPQESQECLLTYYKRRSFTPRLTTTKCLRPGAVAIAPWVKNLIYVISINSHQVVGIDGQKGKIVQRIMLPDMSSPIGIAVSESHEEIYVTDKSKHCIHVFSKNGTLLRTLGNQGHGKGQFFQPEGIAFATNNRLFVCDTGNNRIQVINCETGDLIHQFGYTGIQINKGTSYDISEFNVPTDIAVTENNVVVADSENRRIKIYNLEGKKQFEFGTLGKNRGQFKSPEVVAVDPMGFIFVGDSGNARIQIFTPSGNLVRVFNCKNKLAWVSGLLVTPNLDIVVTDHKTHSVHIF